MGSWPGFQISLASSQNFRNHLSVRRRALQTNTTGMPLPRAQARYAAARGRMARRISTARASGAIESRVMSRTRTASRTECSADLAHRARRLGERPQLLQDLRGRADVGVLRRHV